MNKTYKYLATIFMALSVLTVVGCTSTPQQEGTAEYIDDSIITTKVKAAILSDATLSVTEINVETFKGVVQLSGFVTSNADINRAISIARDVSGVTSVKNDMQLK